MKCWGTPFSPGKPNNADRVQARESLLTLKQADLGHIYKVWKASSLRPQASRTKSSSRTSTTSGYQHPPCAGTRAESETNLCRLLKQYLLGQSYEAGNTGQRKAIAVRKRLWLSFQRTQGCFSGRPRRRRPSSRRAVAEQRQQEPSRFSAKPSTRCSPLAQESSNLLADLLVTQAHLLAAAACVCPCKSILGRQLRTLR